MKRIIVTIILMSLVLGNYAQTTTKAVTAAESSIDLSKYATKEDMQTQLSKIQKSVDDASKNQTNMNQGKPVEGMAWVVVFMPIVLFFLVIWFVTFRLANGFSVRDALNENLPLAVVERNPIYDEKNKDILQLILSNTSAAAANAANLAPTIQVSGNRSAPSSSRYAALITVFFSLAIAAIFISIYLYTYIQNPNKPIDISNLKDVFIALLTGIAPYGLNRLGAGIQGGKAQ